MNKLGLVIALMLGTGCMTGSASYGYGAEPSYAQASYVGTGVYVNGTEITANDKAQLDAVIGQSVPAGRYWMDASYNFGYEGESASVNLRELYAARHPQAQAPQRGSMSMYSTDTSGRGSSIVSEGNCTILSTPDGSLSSGC